MGCIVTAGNTPLASVIPLVAAMNMSSTRCWNATSGLNVHVTYVSRYPAGLRLWSSCVRFVIVVMRIVDARLGIEDSSWKMGGLMVGSAYSMLVVQRYVPFR